MLRVVALLDLARGGCGCVERQAQVCVRLLLVRMQSLRPTGDRRAASVTWGAAGNETVISLTSLTFCGGTPL